MASFTEAEHDYISNLLGLPSDYFYSGNLPGPPSWFLLPLSDWKMGLAIRLGMSNEVSAGLNLVVRWSTTMISATLRIPTIVELDVVRPRLSQLASFAWHPLLLPSIVAEFWSTGVSADLALHKTRIEQFERETGMNKNRFHVDKLNAQTFVKSKDQQLNEMTNQILAFKNALGDIVFKIQTALDLLQFLQETDESECEWWGSEYPDKLLMIRKRFDLQKMWAENCLVHGYYVAQRVSALSDSCSTLTAQQEPHIKLQLALDGKSNCTDMHLGVVPTLAIHLAAFFAIWLGINFLF